MNVATVDLSIAAYLSFTLIAFIEAAGAAKSIEAFGPHPFGLPWYLFLPLMFAVVGAPLPLFIRSALIEILLQNGTLTPDELPARAKRRSAIAKWALGYFMLLIALWICYCEWRGI